jgi:hypothetical protein
MPTRKPRLSQAERGTYFTAARQLREAGVEIKSLEDLSQSVRAIDIIVAGGLGSLVSESSNGGVRYAVEVRLVARAACTLLRCRMTTKWDGDIVLNSYDGASLNSVRWITRQQKSSINGSKNRFDSIIQVIWSRV